MVSYSYFDVIHPPFPILDETAVVKAYQQGGLPHTLICEIYAVSLLSWPLSKKIAATRRPIPDVRYIWNLTVSAMHEDFLSPSFSTVLACILDLLGRPITSITYNAVNVGSAVALSQSLGLNRNPLSWNLDTRQKSLRIRTWWGLLIHDHWASLCHGTPSHIHRYQWDVPLPEVAILSDGASIGDDHHAETRLKGAQSFIALCQLTNILGEVLPLVYSLRAQMPDTTMKDLRRVETSLDQWEDSLPEWLTFAASTFERQGPGALNLQLSFLALKVCLCRMALQTTRLTDHDEAQYHQVRCRKAGKALIDFVISLNEDEIKVFWLPYTAYHFMSAATLMMRCAFEAQSDSIAHDCVANAQALIVYLRDRKDNAHWDLADICLGQCETTIKQMSDSEFFEFRRRNRQNTLIASDFNSGNTQDKRSTSTYPALERRLASSQPHIRSRNTRNEGTREEDLAGSEDMIPSDGSMNYDYTMDDWPANLPENFYFPDLWQISHADVQY